MKLILITKEDWSNASLGVRFFNVIFQMANLLLVAVAILELVDWVGLILYLSYSLLQIMPVP